jgi:hypothetical protein
MPKLSAGCHYNEEEIGRHLKKKKKGYWPVQSNGNKFATGQILQKPVEVVKGRILAGWAQKSPEPCLNPRWMSAFMSIWTQFPRCYKVIIWSVQDAQIVGPGDITTGFASIETTIILMQWMLRKFLESR